MLSENEIIEILRRDLKPKRFEHSLCVAREAKRLAAKYGADENKAYLAGLVHDATKNHSAEKQLKIFERFGIILSDVEAGSEKLWHAISGAAVAKNDFGICDEEILSAIRCHTTAKANMTKLETVLYIADFTSLDRDYDDVDVMRTLADESLEVALRYALCYTVKDLCERDLAIHPDTLYAYNEILLRGKK